jgi:2-succinyl-6-hydroxy-2,4-cyclohexadiene-1-carboxylate synthase
MANHLRLTALHGFLGQGCDFDLISLQVKKLLPQAKIYAPDLFSAFGEDFLPTSFKEWPQIFEKLLLPQAPFQLNPDASSKRILMGYSLGGRLALDLFLADPYAFDALVLLAPNPGLISSQEKQSRIKSDEIWSQKISEERWSEFLKEWNAQAIFKNVGRSEESLEPVRFLGDYSVEKLKRALTTLSLGHMRHEATILSQHQSRIFWLSGEADPKIHPLYQTLKAEGVIRHWLTVPQAGHRLLFDNPHSIAEHLVQITNL